jgi:RNA polymerase sigma-70 factor (ECF subfamily)
MDQEKLIAAFRSRDPEALGELVELYGDRLFRSACLLCGNETDAQDLVQDTFVEAVRSAHRFGGRSTIYTWLHAILLNLARHHHRRKKIVGNVELDEGEIAVMPEGPAQSDLEIANSALAGALQQLSAAHREVLLLRYYEHLKIHEIATHLNVSKGTVKSRLHYALAELQQRLPCELNLFAASGTKERT